MQLSSCGSLWAGCLQLFAESAPLRDSTNSLVWSEPHARLFRFALPPLFGKRAHVPSPRKARTSVTLARALTTEQTKPASNQIDVALPLAGKVNVAGCQAGLPSHTSRDACERQIPFSGAIRIPHPMHSSFPSRFTLNGVKCVHLPAVS